MSDRAEIRLGELAADVLIDAIRSRSLTSSTRLLVDNVPERPRLALFEAMLGRCNNEAAVRAIRDEPHRLRALAVAQPAGPPLSIVPFLVAEPVAGDQNRGDESFASTLRDFFSLDAAAVRVLVTLTPKGNETQRSAADRGADGALVTLRSLVKHLLARNPTRNDEVVGRVVECYLDALRPNDDWDSALDRLGRYLYLVQHAPDEAAFGAALPELGLFLPDPTTGFATGERAFSDRKSLSEWRSGATRLHENAALRAYLEQVFDNPLYEPKDALSTLFDHMTVTAVVDAGRDAVSTIEYGSLGRSGGKSERIRPRWHPGTRGSRS